MKIPKIDNQSIFGIKIDEKKDKKFRVNSWRSGFNLFYSIWFHDYALKEVKQ
ncbi:hypothetical protein [Thermodesulfobacterium hydrogeniphilum]|uniref:hypothetical protein n=1 Tax=Thermodesulfobacterium hydrogeniphilum TaxID=161156 RepID=UPI0012EBEAE4|nr:hypothetical protein [Thermodesulfobacterium hydrogeniphilum]